MLRCTRISDEKLRGKEEGKRRQNGNCAMTEEGKKWKRRKVRRFIGKYNMRKLCILGGNAEEADESQRR